MQDNVQSQQISRQNTKISAQSLPVTQLNQVSECHDNDNQNDSAAICDYFRDLSGMPSGRQLQYPEFISSLQSVIIKDNDLEKTLIRAGDIHWGYEKQQQSTSCYTERTYIKLRSEDKYQSSQESVFKMFEVARDHNSDTARVPSQSCELSYEQVVSLEIVSSKSKQCDASLSSQSVNI